MRLHMQLSNFSLMKTSFKILFHIHKLITESQRKKTLNLIIKMLQIQTKRLKTFAYNINVFKKNIKHLMMSFEKPLFYVTAFAVFFYFLNAEIKVHICLLKQL